MREKDERGEKMECSVPVHCHSLLLSLSCFVLLNHASLHFLRVKTFYGTELTSEEEEGVWRGW